MLKRKAVSVLVACLPLSTSWPVCSLQDSCIDAILNNYGDQWFKEGNDTLRRLRKTWISELHNAMAEFKSSSAYSELRSQCLLAPRELVNPQSSLVRNIRDSFMNAVFPLCFDTEIPELLREHALHQSHGLFTGQRWNLRLETRTTDGLSAVRGGRGRGRGGSAGSNWGPSTTLDEQFESNYVEVWESEGHSKTKHFLNKKKQCSAFLGKVSIFGNHLMFLPHRQAILLKHRKSWLLFVQDKVVVLSSDPHCHVTSFEDAPDAEDGFLVQMQYTETDFDAILGVESHDFWLDDIIAQHGQGSIVERVNCSKGKTHWILFGEGLVGQTQADDQEMDKVKLDQLVKTIRVW